MSLPVILLSDFNLGVFGRYLRHDDSEPLVDVELGSFGALFSDLGGGPDRPDAVALVWTRPEGVLPAYRQAAAGQAVDLGRLDDEVLDFARLLASAVGRHRHVLMASWVSAPGERGLGMLDWRPGIGNEHALARANLVLAEQLARHTNVHLLDTEAWIRAAGPLASSPKQWFTSKVPYVNAVFQAAVPEVKAALMAITTAPRKLLVLDLDDTIWGGVVGDVGWEGIRLGGHDHVGEAFLEFQQALRALAARGTLLGVVSKNTEDIALAAFDRHPEMVLRRDDLSGWRINWGDKATNLAALVDELNLGLDSVVFIDDSAAERDRVRGALPDVLVPEWPLDPAHFTTALRGLRCFDRTSVTGEDRTRSGMYTAERARRASRATVGSMDDWLTRLELQITVGPVGPENIERVAQLINKTNQMNLTNRRASAGELLAWLDEPGRQLLAVSVSDRFGSGGLCGVIGIALRERSAALADFVLSCRVMGRHVEEAMLHVASIAARAAGATELVARLVPTERNGPCLDFLQQSTLEELGPYEFRWTGDGDYPLPGFIDLDTGQLPKARTDGS